MRGEDAGSCSASLALMTAVLGWDFRHTSVLKASLFQGTAQAAAAKRTEINSVSPGESWSQVLSGPGGWILYLATFCFSGKLPVSQSMTHLYARPLFQQSLPWMLVMTQILLSPGTSDWLVELMAVLAPAMASPACAPPLRTLASNARQLLVAFCSLSGDVLPRRPRIMARGSQGSEAEAAAATAQGAGSKCVAGVWQADVC